jgi:hypothetical protein
MRRVGGFIRAGFAGFWSFGAARHRRGHRACAGRRARRHHRRRVRLQSEGDCRPHGPGREPYRAVTFATVVHLVASLVAPAPVMSAGYDDWSLPAVAVTIGALLWLHHRVVIPRYRRAGVRSSSDRCCLSAALDGVAFVATTGVTSGGLALTIAALGFHDLSRHRHARRPDAGWVTRAVRPTRPAGAGVGAPSCVGGRPCGAGYRRAR